MSLGFEPQAGDATGARSQLKVRVTLSRFLMKMANGNLDDELGTFSRH